MNPKNRKLVQGVGINDANYVVRRHNPAWVCPYYLAWTNLLKRCYDTKYQDRQPTYKGCTVTDEWLTFTNFKAWMEKQDFEDKQLDKDLLFEGNKLYSPDTCVFVTQAVNKFTNDRGNDRGKWLIGTYWHKKTEKFKSQCSNPFTGKQEHLGLFNCEQEAHNTWAKRKLELAHELAALQTDQRVANALIDRYLPQVRD